MAIVVTLGLMVVSTYGMCWSRVCGIGNEKAILLTTT